MELARYPLPRPPAGAQVHALPLEQVNQAILFSHLRSQDLLMPTGTLIPVVLVPDLLGGGWRVRWEFGIIGSLSAGLRAQFPAIERIHAVHLEAQAWARVCVDKQRGLLDATVELPAPDLVVPRNAPRGLAVLPQGHRLPATLDGDDRQMLGRVEGVDVLVDGVAVAQLEYAPLIDAPLAVRVFVIDGVSFVDLGLGDPLEVPELPEWEPPAPAPEPVVDPTQPWAVTMDAEEVMTPNPTGPRIFVIPAGTE